ncbi:MAG: class I SAM-dependent methyltransferase [Desulfobulbaceae bacterium]
MNLSTLFRLFRKKNDKSHWERVYASHPTDSLGWYQERPETSLALIRESGIAQDAPLIDVGGGTSRLAASLLDAGYTDVTVFDISGEALRAARQELGEGAAQVKWIEGDITTFDFERCYDLWHDRAVFHFLTEPELRERYLRNLKMTVSGEGFLVLATFGPDAPARCSGLPVVRYTPESLQNEVGGEFELVRSVEEEHRTPGGTKQQFVYCLFRRTRVD